MGALGGEWARGQTTRDQVREEGHGEALFGGAGAG